MNSEWGLNENDGNYSVLVAQKVFESVGESDSNSKKKKTILAKLIPTLRILTRSKLIIASVRGNFDPPPLEDLDALLGCSILVFPENVLKNMNSHSPEEKNTICSTYFHAINWLIEIINAFTFK